LGQYINLTADFFPTRQPNASCFIFFADPHFLKTFLASRTSGTFGFAPTHKADPSAKPKESLFSQRTDNNSYFSLMNLNE
jgi:hypothetical protein